ncbi:protein moonraker [Pelobates fuscus]|uniref:protein moonraker n=1 Tax=Pelobates fuscus TaxID=191477 RepID=UPI002FE48A4E
MAVDFQHYSRMVQEGLTDISGVHNASLRGSYRTKESQLQFNRNVLTHPANLAAHFSAPSPIVIEKLCTPQQNLGQDINQDNALRNSISTVSFSVVSEDRLNLALQLAKRDVKRKHVQENQEGRLKLQMHEGSSQVKSDVPSKHLHKLKAKTQIHKESKNTVNASKSEVTKSGARVYVYTPDRYRMHPVTSDSPPTHDSGPENKTSPKTVTEPSELEVKRLQKELRKYMQKIEELASKERSGERLDPAEQARGRMRQQERATRSARMLYVLQQQVKEIQEDLEELSPQKIKHTKKSRTMSRLAAVHRGAIRALQLFITQLSERGEQQIPTLYKELGHLIRQLSLCTAKVGTGSDPTASETILSILQQAEDLDLLLERKISSHIRRQSPRFSTSRSPSTGKRSNCDTPAGSPTRNKKCPPPVLKQRNASQEKWKDVKKRLVVESTNESLTTATQTEPVNMEYPSSPERREALQSALKALVQAGGLKGIPKTEVAQHRHKGVLLPHRPQGFRHPRKTDLSQQAHFQKKTVAFALKENRPPVREKKIPWVPPNPTSPSASPKRINLDREKKKTNSLPKKPEHDEISEHKEPETTSTVPTEAVRLAWLDAESARRTQELSDLYQEEISHIRNLREEVLQTSRLSGSGMQSHQTFNHGDLPGRGIDHILQESDQLSRGQNSAILLHNSDLETMIQRMEEIERSQEIVRQRCSRIVYADPEFWAQEEKDKESAGRQQIPRSPHPIRITKDEDHREPVVDIVLEEPFEGDSLQMAREELVRSSPQPLPQKLTGRHQDLVPISVPKQMLQSIKNYTETFERHLRLTSNEVLNNFNPWHISESIADELFEDALGEVASELQDMCEGYSEAIYTSEFLEPVAPH